MKLNILDEGGFYIEDYVEGAVPKYWTRDLVGNGYYSAQYQGAVLNTTSGEFSGGRWVETGGISQERLEAIQEANRAAAVAEQGVRMLHSSNVISTLEDEQEFTGVGRAEELTTWRLYRVRIKNVDVNQWPVLWPETPSLTKE